MTSESVKSRIFNRELKLRVMSALVLGVVTLVLTWVGGYPFVLLVAVAAIAILFEYNRMCGALIPVHVFYSGFAALLIVIFAWFAGLDFAAFCMASAAAIVLAVWEIMDRRTIWSPIGFAYATLPFFAMSSLRGDTEFGLYLILILFACVWGADVFAYFFGKTIGGPKLAPRLSPQKTWAGFIGSLIGAVVMSASINVLFGYPVTDVFVGLILVLAVLSQIGDLIESMLKRKFGVKDSGTLIPGHGGVLDRVDGLIVAAVGLWMVLSVMQMQTKLTTSFESLFTHAFLML